MRLLVLCCLVSIGCGSDDGEGPTSPTSESPRVFVNELLASNDSVNVDPDFGEAADWVELYNAESEPVALGGVYLTDDADEPTKWLIPAGVMIDAGGYLGDLRR